MKFVLATITCAAITVATIAAQNQTPPTQTPQQSPKPDVTLTGCVIQGSGPTVFLFDNARKNPKDKTEKGTRYVIVAVGEDLPLRSNLNHEVELMGQAETKTLPTTGKVEEKDLPKFSAKSLTLVSNTCSAPDGK
jgi:hypothetical protein